jgi:molecular chaperone DnaK
VGKTLTELGEKVDGAERAKIESAISDLRSALKAEDKAVIEKKTEALAQASAALAQRAYADTQGSAGAGAGGPEGGPSPEGAPKGPGREDVVDAEFEEVKDKDRKAS